MQYVVMGVCGCGKSHIGTAFADAIGGEFIDGDDLHPPANIAKMAQGQPLTDDDRAPWLDLVGDALANADDNTVIGCSALRRIYRDRIRTKAGRPVTFLHLKGSRNLISERLRTRDGHFMPPDLLDSQIATLEAPGPEENAVSVDINQSPDAIVAQLLDETRESRRWK